MSSGRKAFERKVAALEALRAGDPDAARAPVGGALRERSNYLVARAAEPFLRGVAHVQDASMAIEQLNREEGALLLRLKLLLGDREPDVQGQCCTSYLSLAPRDAVSFIARFLHANSEDVQLESASALLQNPGASPLQEAADFLLGVVARESVDLAAAAIAALAIGRCRGAMESRVMDVV